MELTKKSDFVISTERSEWRNLLYRYVERCLDSRWSLDMTVNRRFLVSYSSLREPLNNVIQSNLLGSHHLITSPRTCKYKYGYNPRLGSGGL